MAEPLTPDPIYEAIERIVESELTGVSAWRIGLTRRLADAARAAAPVDECTCTLLERLDAAHDGKHQPAPDPVAGLRERIEALDTPENHDPEGHDALPDPVGLREALAEWGKGFLNGLSFNVPTLQENGWAERRAPDIAGSILSDAGVRAALLSQPTPLDVERLARAMHQVICANPDHDGSDPDDPCIGLNFAADLYARLSSETPE